MSEEEEEEHGSSFSDSLIMRLLLCKFSWFRRNRLEGFNEMEILEKLGEGAFGKVFRCRDRETGDIVAVKQVWMPRQNRGIVNQLKITRESDVLKGLDHDNIVRLQKALVTEDRKHMYLVFEILDCNLYQYIRSHRQDLDSVKTKSFMRQILSAVAFCHARGILHRDLKPKNLLIDESGNTIKLADFGIAREFGDRQYTENMGTRWYRAPEILFSTPYSTPVDLWSVGCIFGEMVLGKPIFRTLHPSQTELEGIFGVLGTPTEATWPGVTTFNDYPNYGQYNPMDLLTHFADLGPDGLDLLTRLLCLDPNQRISANDALEHAYFNDVNLVNEEAIE